MTLIFALFIYRILFENMRSKQVLGMTNFVLAFCLSSAEFKIKLVTLHTVARWHFSRWNLTAFLLWKFQLPNILTIQTTQCYKLLILLCYWNDNAKNLIHSFLSCCRHISRIKCVIALVTFWNTTFICRSPNPHMVIRFIFGEKLSLLRSRFIALYYFSL